MYFDNKYMDGWMECKTYAKYKHKTDMCSSIVTLTANKQTYVTRVSLFDIRVLNG